jgi:hypothetical protein
MQRLRDQMRMTLARVFPDKPYSVAVFSQDELTSVKKTEATKPFRPQNWYIGEPALIEHIEAFRTANRPSYEALLKEEYNSFYQMARRHRGEIGKQLTSTKRLFQMALMRGDGPEAAKLYEWIKQQRIPDDNTLNHFFAHAAGDRAMAPVELLTNAPGGIDLTKERMNVDIEGNSASVAAPMDVKAMENIEINALYIKDLAINPLNDLPALLGISN